jgi:hypothetical protein
MLLNTPCAKIRTLEQKIVKVQLKNKSANMERRRLRSRMVELFVNRDYWKARCKSAESSLKSISIIAQPEVESKKIERHQYSSLMVKLCVSIYISGNCGLRSTIKMIKCMCLITGIESGKIPCKSSLVNWIQKLGYSVYEQCNSKFNNIPYGLIIDECMVIGQEKLLVILGICAHKTDKGALCQSQIEVLYMGVSGVWTGSKVAQAIAKVTEKEGKKPVYVISDKGSILCKGIKEAGLIRIADVGHEIARLTEFRYQKGDLEEFTVAASLCKAKYIMTEMAYLLCPKQRKMARFMNLNTVFDWGKNILTNFERLNEKERKGFDWVKKHEKVIRELSCVFETTKKILEIIKNEGLSYNTINQCLEICCQKQLESTIKSGSLMEDIYYYLLAERCKLPNEKTTWYGSTDIIESFFGTVKSRQASNPLHGVTRSILFLPLMTKIERNNLVLNINIKQAMESVYMSDLERWNKEQLIDNQVVKRNKLFKK